jgi:hypothetical protein
MTATKKTPRGRGRPALPKSKGKRHAAGFRMTKEMRQELEAASRRTGRPLSHEIEALLLVALNKREALPTLLDQGYGFHTSGLLQLIAALTQASEQLELDWLNDPGKFATMRAKVDLIFQRLAPADLPAPNPKGLGDADDLLGKILRATPSSLYYEILARGIQLRLGDTALNRAQLRLIEEEVASS